MNNLILLNHSICFIIIFPYFGSLGLCYVENLNVAFLKGKYDNFAENSIFGILINVFLFIALMQMTHITLNH